MPGGLLNPRQLVLLLVALLIAFALLPSLFTAVVNFADLAILGSFSGGSSLALIVGTVALAAVVVAVVDSAFGGKISSAIGRRFDR